MNGEWFGASPKARRHSLFLLIERDQIHVANTGYDRITFAAIIVNSRDACWLASSSYVFLLFLSWISSLRY